jgi:hypothetical protein
MPADYGRLSAADKARLKRARRRAGVSKPTPPPVRGENASEKARVSVQARARENFGRVERGEMSAADFARSIAGLKPAEKKDLGSYSKARSERTQKKAFGSMVRQTPGAVAGGYKSFGEGVLMGASAYALGDPDFRRALPGLRDSSRASKDTLMDRRASLREKLDAAGNITAVAGLGGVGRSGKTPARGPKKPPKDVLYHGSPDGIIGDVDPYHHTKPWEEGIGFYVTESLDKSVGYAKGRTASPSRKQGKGAVSYVKLKPGAKVLDMDAPADMGLWRDMARGAGFTDKDFDYYLLRQAGANPTNKRMREEFLIQLRDVEGSDALYGLEEGLAARGIQATTHMEGAKSTPHRVWVVKDKDAVEIVGGDTLSDLTPPPPPPVPPPPTRIGEPDPLTGDEILKALPEARRTRAEQQKGYKAERAKRNAAAAQARAAAGGGEAGRIAAKAEFKGELPRLSFDKLVKRYGEADSATRAVYQPQVEQLLDQIAAHPSMRGQYSIEGTQAALTKALDGVTPTKSEIRNLEAVFGDDAADYFKGAIAKEKALKALNLPRSLQATFDLSRALRQDIMVLPRHPRMWAKNWKPMTGAALSDDKAKALMDLIHNDPVYDDAIDHGLALTELGGATKKLEEDMIGVEYAEKIPVLKHGVRFANRGYAVGGAMQRLQLYKLYLRNAENKGKALTKRDKRELASVANALTGRGNMGFDALEKAAPLLTMGLFSPRLIASRVAFMNPYWYGRRLHGAARREAIESMALFVAAGTATLAAAAQIPGVEVGVDPRSADFGKIKVGDTRIDIWGGFQQYVVNFERFRRGEKVSSMTGEVTEQKPSETAIDFLRNKAAPLPGYAWNAVDNETSGGQPFDRVTGAGKLFLPLNWQNTYAAAKEDPGAGAASFGLGFFGVGTNTYSSDPEQVAEAKQRMRGPVYVRNHEDRMTALKAELKKKGRDADPAAVKASRTIRNMDMAKRRAEKKKGDTLSSQEKARLALTTYKRFDPSGAAKWDRRLAGANSEDRWQFLYEKLREEIARPFKRYGVNMEPSED